MSGVRPDRMEQAKARVGTIELGAFRLTRLLAAGSFATAYLAEQVSTGDPAVVKIAHPDLFIGARATELRARFEMEARAAARVRHASLVRIRAAGATTDGVPAIAMDYVTGPSLAAVLTSRRGVDLAFVDRCVTGLAETLRLLHDAGVVHRDVTPRNVVWTSTADGIGRPVLLDFGVAKLDNRSLGTVGAMGTPGYMPPEQLFGRAVPRSDVYALGAILWWACTGRSFLSQFDDVEDLLAYQMGEREPPDPVASNRRLAPDLADLLVWCLEPDPGTRPTAVQLLDAWRAIHPALVAAAFTPPPIVDSEERLGTDEDPPQELEIATQRGDAPARVAPEVCLTMDDPQLLRLVAAYLRGDGHVVEVTTAPTGSRGDGRAAPRLFVLEAQLHGMDADELAAELVAEAPGSAVVLVSSTKRPASSAHDGFHLPAELDAFATRVYELLHGDDAVPNTWLPLPLNRDTVARLGESGDPGRAALQIEGFLHDFPTWAEQLDVAVDTTDWNAARATCARMSRAASLLGADRLADLAQVVQALAEAQAPSVARIVGDLHAEFGRVRQALSLTRAQYLHA
jgi:serine/threonine protein kinase/CheY-like chemotaxis protein